MDGPVIPGSEGSIGPGPAEYTQPHVYARDVTSGAGNCVCGCPLGDGIHTEAAPGVPVPDTARPPADVAKAAEEQRFVLGIAYQAGPDPRIAKGVDGGRDFFTPVELEKAAWSFMLGGQQHGLFHVDGTEGAARPVESFIYRNPVPWIVSGDSAVRKAVAGLAAEAEACAGPGDMVVHEGDWCLGAILDDRAWQLHKAGRINGWSPQGVARRRRVRPA